MSRKPLVFSLILALAGCAGSQLSQDTASHAEAGDVSVSTHTRTSVATGGDGAAAPMAPMADSGGAPVRVAEGGMPGGGEMAMEEAPAMAPPPPAEPATGAVRATTTTSTTTTVTVTVDTPTPTPAEVQQIQQPVRALTAATVGDHDRRGNYLQYLGRHPFEAQRLGLDMTRRVRFKVVDAGGQPLNDAALSIQIGNSSIQGRTHADGVWDFFPGMHQVAGNANVVVSANGSQGRAQLFVNGQGDSQDVVLRLNQVQAQSARVLDLGFLIDVTGSMEDELRYVNSEIADIVARITAEAPETQVRVGAVFYRDRHDSPALQRIAFTRDIGGFARAMQGIHASGGGDYPEDLNAGLHQAIAGLGWTGGNAVRTLVVISDAPPQRYQTQFDYRTAMLQAAARGIRILPVAASGADREVEFLFRAMATMTSSPYVYLTDDSGIGNHHMEADTDRVAVEYFHDLLTRLVIDDIHGHGMHEAI
ncbi:MAG: VWA domain-containing protein [Deltaproteobacteria bacterium]|nr:VWA domain-containing protein [Deltaproteobacteria bacterium]